MIYRVPKGWIEQRRRSSWIGAALFLCFAIALFLFLLGPRVIGSDPEDRRAAMMVTSLIFLGLLFGGAAGRFSFRNTMRRWETFSVQLTSDALIRQMDGQETAIQRDNVSSVREVPRRGFVITDNLGWRIFVPKIVANYEDFRERIIAWAKKN